MMKIFIDVQEEQEIDFAQIYLSFATDEDRKIQRKAACFLHEIFLMLRGDYDLQIYKDVFLEFLMETNSKIMKTINENFVAIIINFKNDFNKSLPHTPQSCGGSRSPEGGGDFTSMVEPKPIIKRRKTIMIAQNKDLNSDDE